jgi:hypothetical protein
MSTVTTRRGLSAFVVIAALLFAALAATSQASASTLYACVKKNGSARVFSKKPKCKKGETKLSWNNEGAAGKNGLNGNNGLNGLNGTNGTSGKDLTTHTPLPSGQSQSGFFALGGGSSTTGYSAEGITFSQPLAAPIAENHVVYNTLKKTTPQCPGFGQAAPGFVCMYESEGVSMEFFVARDFLASKSNAADIYGFAAFFVINATGGFIAGSWTVTAP